MLSTLVSLFRQKIITEANEGAWFYATPAGIAWEGGYRNTQGPLAWAAKPAKPQPSHLGAFPLPANSCPFAIATRMVVLIATFAIKKQFHRLNSRALLPNAVVRYEG